ncbi:MAG TPA: response regulator transcription factor [Anaerolineaceae bacterium]
MTWVSKTRVVLVDDHDVVRKGIRNLLRKAADIVVIGEANNGYDAIKMVNQLRPDVLLLDIEMPGMNGVDVVRKLEEAGLSTNILVLSAYDDQVYIMEMLGSGAAGYLLKEETPEYILDAVRGVASGQKGWVSAQVAKKLGRPAVAQTADATLTFREMDLLRLLESGKSDAEIANIFALDEKSVGQMFTFLVAKLACRNREEMLGLAKQRGWVD